MEYLPLLAALLPPFVYLFYITRKDSANPEPKSALFKALLWGLGSYFLTGLIRLFVDAVYDASKPQDLFDVLWVSFIQAGCVEEFAKLVCLYLCVRKNKHFDEHLDGIVYASFVALGFAAIENVDYVFLEDADWVSTAFMRSFTAVPGHCLFGVIMGYYFSLWWFKKDRKSMFLMLAVPILAHGVYDSVCFYSGISDWFACISIFVCLYVLNVMRKKGLKMMAELKESDKQMLAELKENELQKVAEENNNA